MNENILFLIIGLAVGAVIAVLSVIVSISKRKNILEENKTLKTDNEKLSGQIEELSSFKTEKISLAKTLELKEAECVELKKDKDILNKDLKVQIALASENQSKVSSLNEKVNELNATIDKKNEAIESKDGEINRLKSDNARLSEANSKHDEEIVNAKNELNSAFKEMAERIFKENTQTFSASSEKGIGEILNPLKTQIEEFRKKVEDSYAKEHDEKLNLQNEIQNVIKTSAQLSTDAKNLTSALKGDHKMQGNWGEMQLEQILQMAGLEKGVHYQTQQHFVNDENRTVIPDVVVNLPDGKNYVIDSKVSLVAYERFYNAETDEERATEWTEHIRNIRNHIDGLSKKSYQNLYGINAPDYVFMFMPIEGALTQALQSDGELYSYALNKNIVLVSSTLLLATLRTVSFIWKQDLQRTYVDQITKEAGDLYDGFVILLDELRKAKDAIGNCDKALQSAVNKLNDSPKYATTLIGKVEKLREMGVKNNKQLNPNVLKKLGLDNIIDDEQE